MEKYNKTVKCDKCSSNQINDEFLPEGKCHFRLSGNSKFWETAEFDMMKRTCNNCGYEFYELPLDSKEN